MFIKFVLYLLQSQTLVYCFMGYFKILKEVCYSSKNKQSELGMKNVRQDKSRRVMTQNQS